MDVDREPLRKELALRGMREHLGALSNPDFWRGLVPGARITDEPFGAMRADAPPPTPESLGGWTEQLREDRYFQTGPLLARRRIDQMLRCIEGVRRAGLPETFALVYDVFFEVFADMHALLVPILGGRYRIVPNFWIYYIEPSDRDHGFEPHRDAEYADTIGEDGLPTLLTVWVALTDATALNSCMYVVPAGRDPNYASAIESLHQDGSGIRLEDIRALPAAAGTVSCWDQYLYHWGSRSSDRAAAPRVSYALYCQRGDVDPVDSVVVDVPSPVSFTQRLTYACRGLHRYSYLSLRDSKDGAPILDFLERHMAGQTRTH